MRAVKARNLKAGSAEKYYFQKDPIFNPNGENENTGWIGVGADALGLDKHTLEQQEFKNLLNGKDADGTVLVKGGTTGDKRSAIDIPLGAPKSVSHLALMQGGDKRLIDAHDSAVAATMKFIENNYAMARDYAKDENGKLIRDEKGNPQRIEVKTGNLVVAQAKHSLSRDEDPHLHTHNVIMNITYDKNSDSFKALHNDAIFKNQSTIADVYKSELAKNIQGLGYGIEKKANGDFEIAGYSQGVNDLFSKRKAEIEDMKAELKANGFSGSDSKLHDQAQHMYKKDKNDDTTAHDLYKSWNKQMADNGYSMDSLKEQMKDAASLSKSEKTYTVDSALKEAGEILTSKEATFSKDELLRTALQLSRGDLSSRDIEKGIDSIKKTGQNDSSDLKKLNDGSYTTKEMFDIEKDNMKRLDNQNIYKALMTEEQANKAIDEYNSTQKFPLTEGQRNAVFNMLTSKDQFMAIQGDAGVGKTTQLDAFNQILSKQNSNTSLEVLAPTGKAASEAFNASGIKSGTIDSFILKNNTKSMNNNSNADTAGFIKVPNDYKQAFNDKFVVGAKPFNVGFSRGGITTSTTWKNDLFGQNKSTTNETIKTGAYAGTTRQTKREFSGDYVKSASLTVMNDGTKIVNKNEAYLPKLSPFMDNKFSTTVEKDGAKTTHEGSTIGIKGIVKQSTDRHIAETDGKNTKTVDNKNFSILGFKASTSKVEVWDKDGNLVSAKITQTKSFLGKEISSITKVEDGKLTEGQVEKNGNKTVSMSVKESAINKENVKEIYDKLSSLKAEQGGGKYQSSKSPEESFKQGIKEEMIGNQKILFVDESSMLSAKKANEILKYAENTGARVAFMGDKKQLQSIESGKFFDQLKEKVQVSIVDQSVRQKTDDTKAVASLLKENKTAEALALMDKQQNKSDIGKSNLVEKKEYSERVEYAANFILKDVSNSIVVASKRKEVNDINNSVREKLFGTEKGSSYSIAVPQNDSWLAKRTAETYSVGDKITVKDDKQSWTVDKVDKIKNTISVSSSDGEKKEIDLKKHGFELSREKMEEKTFRAGDQIVFTKNDKNLGVNNGERGEIKEINGSKFSVVLENKKVVNIDVNDYKRIDHGYAMTITKSQGTTVDRVAAFMSADNKGMNSSNSTLVALTRARNETVAITDDKKLLLEQVSRNQVKKSTIDADKGVEKVAVDAKSTASEIKASRVNASAHKIAETRSSVNQRAEKIVEKHNEIKDLAKSFVENDKKISESTDPKKIDELKSANNEIMKKGAVASSELNSLKKDQFKDEVAIFKHNVSSKDDNNAKKENATIAFKGGEDFKKALDADKSGKDFKASSENVFKSEVEKIKDKDEPKRQESNDSNKALKSESEKNTDKSEHSLSKGFENSKKETEEKLSDANAFADGVGDFMKNMNNSKGQSNEHKYENSSNGM